MPRLRLFVQHTLRSLFGQTSGWVRGVVRRELGDWHQALYPKGERTGWALADVIVGLGVLGTLVRLVCAVVVSQMIVVMGGTGWLVVLGLMWGVTLVLVPIVAHELLHGSVRATGRGGMSFSVIALVDVAWAVLGILVTSQNPFAFALVLLFMLAEHGALVSWKTMLVATVGAGCALVMMLGGTLQVVWLMALGMIFTFIGSQVRGFGERLGALRHQVEWEREEPYRLLEELGAAVVVRSGSDIRGRGHIGLTSAQDVVRLLEAREDFASKIHQAMEGTGRWQGSLRLELDGVRLVDWTVASWERMGAGNDWEWLSKTVRGERVVVIVLFDRTRLEAHRAMDESAMAHEAILPMAAGLAHEIRNPLAALISSADQLSELETSDEDRVMLARLVSDEAARLRRLVNDFLELARVHRDNVVHVNASDVVREATELVRSDWEGMQLELDLESVEGYFDVELVLRALGNLVSNAGQVARAGKRIRVRGWRDGVWYRVSVRDWGMGIPLERRGDLFKPFVSRRAGGTGLGLAIVERSARALGGFVECQTPEGALDVGEGVEFVLTWVLDARGTHG